uniref:Uncharacterized protein n=1 Tax=Arundo donax TaxID=35708 RepID=A0A0A9GAR8_ARUDO
MNSSIWWWCSNSSVTRMMEIMQPMDIGVQFFDLLNYSFFTMIPYCFS